MSRIALGGLSVAAALAAALPAAAGGLAPVVATPAPVAPVVVASPVVAPSGDWTGVYAGAQLSWGTFDTDGFDEEGSGTLYGLHAGYLRDFGRFVLGAEAAYDWGGDLAIADGGADVDSLARASLRAGYDGGRFLPYVTVGYERAEFAGIDGGSDGVVYGVGAEYAMTDSVSVGAEFLQHEFDEIGDAGPSGSLSTFGLRASYRF